MQGRIEIYHYLDYRKYLADFYALKKNENSKFSHRYFAHKLGVKSTGFFSEIINSRRNLSSKNIIQFCEVLKLDQEEAQYFEQLVRFNQAKTINEKNHWYQKLLLCKKVDVTKVNRGEYQYFTRWYHTAIRELLYFYPFKDDYKALAVTVVPPIKTEEARASIRLLEQLGYIQKNAEGLYKPKSMVLSTGDRVRSLEVANFQIQTMKLGIQALDRADASDRDITTVTMSLSNQGLEQVKTILRKARKEILKTARQDSEENGVYQMNIQLFPLAAKKTNTVWKKSMTLLKRN